MTKAEDYTPDLLEGLNAITDNAKYWDPQRISSYAQSLTQAAHQMNVKMADITAEKDAQIIRHGETVVKMQILLDALKAVSGRCTPEMQIIVEAAIRSAGGQL